MWIVTSVFLSSRKIFSAFLWNPCHISTLPPTPKETSSEVCLKYGEPSFIMSINFVLCDNWYAYGSNNRDIQPKIFTQTPSRHQGIQSSVWGYLKRFCQCFSRQNWSYCGKVCVLYRSRGVFRWILVSSIFRYE